jgi:hypothetical protein
MAVVKLLFKQVFKQSCLTEIMAMRKNTKAPQMKTDALPDLARAHRRHETKCKVSKNLSSNIKRATTALVPNDSKLDGDEKRSPSRPAARTTVLDKAPRHTGSIAGKLKKEKIARQSINFGVPSRRTAKSRTSGPSFKRGTQQS